MKYEIMKQKWRGISLIISAIAALIATFFMRGQEFTAIGGIIMILTVPFSIAGFSTIFEKFRTEMPWYANWGFILYLFGAVASVNFGLRGVFGEVFELNIAQLELATKQHPGIFMLIFFAIGPAYPLSILLLGINLFRKKLAAKWITILLIMAAISFPPSRISRIPELMHLCDLLLSIPLFAIGIDTIRSGNKNR